MNQMKQMIGYLNDYQAAVDQIGYELMFKCAADLDADQLDNIDEFELSMLMAAKPEVFDLIQESLEGMTVLFSKPFIEVQNDVLDALGNVDFDEILEVQHLRKTNRLN